MANLARAVVLAAAATLVIGALGPADPEGSPWDAGYLPGVLQVAPDSRRIHSYDLVKDAHVLVTFTATNHNVWELQTAVSFDVHNTGTTLDRVKICEDRRTGD